MKRIIDALSKQNYRRRVRTVSLNSVRSVVEDAIVDGYGWASGGWVANCYGYPATSVCVVAAVRRDLDISIAIGSNNARKGIAPCPWNVPISRIRPDGPVALKNCQEWAENPIGGFIIPRAEAMFFAANWQGERALKGKLNVEA